MLRLRFRTPLLALASASLSFAGLSACTGELNRGTGPLGATLPDLEPTTARATDVNLAEQDESWQFSEIDRASWEVVVIAAPRGQVETNPSPDFTPAVMVGRGVDSRAMPTAASAVIVSSDGGRVALEGLADPFRAAWSLIESPYGLIVRPPWSTVIAPTPSSFEVLPHSVAATPNAHGSEPSVGE
jgi:hypothetical protein